MVVILIVRPNVPRDCQTGREAQKLDNVKGSRSRHITSNISDAHFEIRSYYNYEEAFAHFGNVKDLVAIRSAREAAVGTLSQ